MPHRKLARRRGPDPARALAYRVLREVSEGAYANLALGQALADARLDARDAAFVTELVAGTCRLAGTYDRVLAAASGRDVARLQPALLDVLRLGAHQLLSMRVPAHAAVGAGVEHGVDVVEHAGGVEHHGAPVDDDGCTDDDGSAGGGRCRPVADGRSARERWSDREGFRAAPAAVPGQLRSTCGYWSRQVAHQSSSSSTTVASASSSIDPGSVGAPSGRTR